VLKEKARRGEERGSKARLATMNIARLKEK
jgi:hypothetical protein